MRCVTCFSTSDMRGSSPLAALLGVLLAFLACFALGERTIYDFTVKDADGKDVKLDKYKNKPVILVVNVASACGYTESNYDQLQQIYEKHKDAGLEIMAFPCNQFGRQEPGSNSEIQEFAASKGATFPVFRKTNVNGPKSDPLFMWLKTTTPGSKGELKWNFSKFLVVKGVPTARYAHDVEPFAIEKDIVKALSQTTAEL